MSHPVQALVSPILKEILFATDFSPCSEAALPYALAIAKLYGSTVHVVHVVGPLAMVGALGVPFPHVTDENQAAQQKVSQLTHSDAFVGVAHSEILQRGPVFDVICRLITERGIDLMVLGTRGRSGLTHVLLGSVAEQVFRRATCPVLTVGPQVSKGRLATEKFATILFATDFSPASMHAFTYALSLARSNKATLVLFHAVRESEIGDTVDVALDHATRRLTDIIPADPGITCQVAAHCGPIGPVILNTAADHHADLIIMGAHRGASASAHSPWAIAHMVVCHAACPVLTVRG